MKALVLAGGRGTRLRPLTHTTNKHLIPIGGKPMIFRVLHDVAELGVDEIIVNVNKGEVEIKEAIGDGSRWGTKVTYIEQELPNGMMYPIILAKDIIGDDDFVLHAGDNILSGGLKSHYEKFKELNSSAHLLVTRVQHPERFGVAVVENGLVTKTVEKPQEFVSNLAVTAVYFYKKDIQKAMANVQPIVTGNSKIAEYYPPLAHQWLIDNGYKVTVSEVTGWWKDTGKPEDLIAANHLALETLETNIEGQLVDTHVEGRLELGNGSVIENSIIRGPVVVGMNCTIINSYIGPFTSISNDCQVLNSEVENSILMNGAKVDDLHIRLDGSLMGYNTYVTRRIARPKNLNLFIGDNSEVKLP
jgi:glucose-1-phosphate thymidylyltransferase